MPRVFIKKVYEGSLNTKEGRAWHLAFLSSTDADAMLVHKILHTDAVFAHKILHVEKDYYTCECGQRIVGAHHFTYSESGGCCAVRIVAPRCEACEAELTFLDAAKYFEAAKKGLELAQVAVSMELKAAGPRTSQIPESLWLQWFAGKEATTARPHIEIRPIAF